MMTESPTSALVRDQHAQLVAHGHACLPALIPAADVEVLREGMEAQWIDAGRPQLYSREDREAGSADRVVSPVGMVISGLLRRMPQARGCVLDHTLHQLLRLVLGPGYRLEMVSGVVSDERRSFFRWHHHVGGIDAYDYRSQDRYPRFDRCERVVCTVYGCALDDERGTMLVAPRRIDAPTDPPMDDLHAPWDRAARVQAPAGSVVVLDQGTWHAVTPMRTAGRRHFVAFYVTRGDAEPARRRDPTLDRAFADYPELAEAFALPSSG